MDTRRVLRRLAAAPRWLLGLAIIGVFVAIALLPQGREGLFGRLACGLADYVKTAPTGAV